MTGIGKPVKPPACFWPAAVLVLYPAVGRTTRGYPWSWGRAGIPYYCCLQLAIFDCDSDLRAGTHVRYSRTTSRGSLSSCIPLNEGWRSCPVFDVHSVNST